MREKSGQDELDCQENAKEDEVVLWMDRLDYVQEPKKEVGLLLYNREYRTDGVGRGLIHMEFSLVDHFLCLGGVALR